MEERYIALAVPVFLLLIAAEWLISRKQKRVLYRFHDTVANLSCGIGQQILGPLTNAVLIGVYAWVWERFAIRTMSMKSIASWIALVLAVDLAYYAFHRASHRVNLLWAGHVVHHQSEEYNLSVALRQNWFEKLFEWVFYLPLAIIGFPPLMFLAASTANTLYQFWIHTRTVRTLGFLEGILNTPSAHRVHHGINPEYIDRNYGGMFAFWDRLFGTWQREEQEPVFGIVKPLHSFNPLWANVHYFAEIGALVRAAPRLADKLRAPFMPPEWRPPELGGRVRIPEVSSASRLPYDRIVPLRTDGIVALQLLLAIVALTWFLATANAPPMLRAGVGVAVLGSTIAWAGAVEGRPWRVPAEAVRYLAIAGCAVAVLA